jgi:hypothetical protein
MNRNDIHLGRIAEPRKEGSEARFDDLQLVDLKPADRLISENAEPSLDHEALLFRPRLQFVEED